MKIPCTLLMFNFASGYILLQTSKVQGSMIHYLHLLTIILWFINTNISCVYIARRSLVILCFEHGNATKVCDRTLLHKLITIYSSYFGSDTRHCIAVLHFPSSQTRAIFLQSQWRYQRRPFPFPKSPGLECSHTE